jgi:hypothetical protein
MTRAWCPPVILATLLVAGSVPASGQIVYGIPAGADLGLVMTSWKLERGDQEVTVDQIVAPVSGFVPLHENTEVRYFLAYGTSEATLDDGAHRLDGLSDVRLQFSRSLSRDRIVLGLGLNLPTGKKSLDLEDEWLVMQYLSQDFLAFPLRRLGEGLGVSATLGGAARWGGVLLGCNLTWMYAGAYESYADMGDYDPGDQISVTLRAETASERLRIWGGVTWSDFTTDTLEGAKVYDQGWYARTSLGLERWSPRLLLSSRASYILRDRSTTYDELGASLNHLRLYGDELAWQALLSFQGDDHGREWRLGPTAELRWIDANEYGRGKALVRGFGLDGGVRLSSRYQLGFGAKYFTGDADGERVSLKGYQASLTLSGVLQ